jgi:hypothetical protein
MIAMIIFFIAGVVLGIIGLRLLNRWEMRGGREQPPTIFRHHS